MSNPALNGRTDENKLVKLYMQLTGLSENTARSVFMYRILPNGERPESAPEVVLPATPQTEPNRGSGVATALLILFCLWSKPVFGAEPAPRDRLVAPSDTSAVERVRTNKDIVNQNRKPDPTEASFPLFTQPLSLAEAVNLALHRNPNVLRAQKDIEAAQGVAIETRAIALPSVGIAGNYSAAQKSDVDIIEAPSPVPGEPGFSLGTPQNWSSQIRLVQSLYQGGRMISALRAARLTREQSLSRYQTALAGTVLDVQLAYYDVLLAQQQITVQEASVELLTQELADTQRRFDAGTVPRFNVLRAEVELANARPRLIRARNDSRTSKNNLANLLGFDVPHETLEDIPLTLADKLTAEPYEVALSQALALALEQRSELTTLRRTEALRKEDVVNAKAGYKPVLQGYVGYDAHNSILSQDLTDERQGWIAGAQLTWNLFDGLRTQGRIREATANYERAGVDVDDTLRHIEFEVRTSYSSFIEARELLESQKKVVEQAEEALRLARARNEAGTGTQLDVLSAQTALTEARSTQIQALHDYEAARARLQRSVGNNVPQPAPP